MRTGRHRIADMKLRVTVLLIVNENDYQEAL